MNLNPKMVSLGVAAGLAYLVWSKKIKDENLKMAAVVVVTTVVVRNTPVVNQYI